jgi:hypothetical protein
MKIKSIVNLTTGDKLMYNEADLPDMYTQVYEHAWEIMASVKQLLSYHLFMYILANMTKENKIALGNDTKNDFVENLHRMGGKKYSMSHVSTAIRELKNVGLLIPINNPTYQVSLLAVWKDSVKNRKEVAESILSDTKHRDKFLGKLEVKQTYKLDE